MKSLFRPQFTTARYLVPFTCVFVVATCLGSAVRASAEAPAPPADALRQDLAVATDQPTTQETAGAGSGVFTPSAGGGATYRIPIVVPPGTAGMQPGLALVYNSHAPSGLLGPGWALDGLAAVTRCGATVAQDGFSGGIAFDANDRFCLAGQRLVVVGAASTSGTEYRTEIGGLVRVIAYGTAGSGPAWFRVWTKAGHTMDFGATSDSRVQAQGKASTLVWALNRIEDPSGNYVRITYHEDPATGESRPLRIDYTGNAATGLAPTRSVLFTYEARPATDVRRLYVGGSRVTLPVVLRRITTSVGAIVARDYRLEYETAGTPGRVRLARVIECAAGGTCLPATQIAWQAPGNASLTTAWSALRPQNVETLAGDFDGDGYTDLIQVWTTANQAQVLRSQGDGTFATAWTSPSTATASGFFWATGPLSTFAGDFNGDGISDVLQIRVDNNVGQVLLGVGDGSFTTAWTSPPDGNDGFLRGTGLAHTLVNDVNGDGLPDIVQVRTDSSWGQVLLARGDGTFKTTWTATGGVFMKGAVAQSFLRDVNGDGRADLVQIRTDQHTAQVLLAVADGSFAPAWTSPASGDGWLVRAGTSQTIVEDVNGDGLADIVQIRTDMHWGQVLLARGDGSFTTAWTSPSVSTESGFVYRADIARTFVGDFNGDRRLDLIQILTDWPDARILTGAGDGSFATAWRSPATGDGSVVRATMTRTVVDDFNGDGVADLVQHRIDSGNTQTLLASSGVPDLVTSIRNPLGGVIAIAYKPATDPSVHDRGRGSGYPTLDRPLAVPLVASTSTSDGRGTTSTLLYRYGGAKYDLHGRGSLGFAWRRIVEAAGGVHTTTVFHQSFPLTGLVASSAVADGAGRIFRQTKNLWTPVATSPATVFARLDQTDTFECDGQPACREISTSFDYDAFGNLTRTFAWGDVAVADQERDEYTEWAIDVARWLHRPARVVVYGPATKLLRERWISYDGLAWGALGTRGLPTREESRLAGAIGAPGNPVLLRTYDGYGNPTSVTDPRGCKTTTTFETVHRTFPRTVTTCLGHATTFAYDARWGLPTSETDPNGQTTTFTYDVFGRLTRLRGPLDAASLYGTTTKEYLDLGNPTLQRVVTYRTAAHGTAEVVWSDEAFDGLGRVYRSRSQGPGPAIVGRTAFDARGLVAKVSAPHLATEAAVWTVFTHDTLRRRTSATKPDGTSTRTAYAPGMVTATDERGMVTRRHLDGFGRVTRVEEVDGAGTYVTLYAYDATGALKTVTNHLGHVTAITYDALGRKTRLVDPNLGTWTYGHDAGGLVTRQTDAKQQAVTFEYDPQGRMRVKRYPGGAQIEWTYDDPAVPYSRGRLTRVVDLAASTGLRYDALGRVTRTDRLLDATTYTLTRTYDALGRITSERFPDGEIVTYDFNAAGWLETVGTPFNATAYVESIAYNARGQRTQVRYANGATSTFGYFDGAADARSFRLKSAVTSGPYGALQSLAYVHDAVGNITEITDALGTASRTFTYDALRRLTSATGTFGSSQASVTESYTYDAIGSLRRKGSVSYAYSDLRHPSAVTGRSDGTTYAYDANGNIVSGAGRAMVWDADHRLAAVTVQAGQSAELAYDHAGQRVRKIVNGTSVTRYPFPGYEIDPTGVVTKRFAGVATRSNGQKLFYHDDHLGGVHVVTDAKGVRVQLVEYDPWGAVSRSEGTADLTHRFTGQLLDPETGLMYYGSRYYDPKLGRFISPDPFVPEPANPQALNRYSYVANNPVNAIDPTGYSFWDDLGDFFENLGRSLIRNAPAIVAGVAIGALAVATGGFGLGLTGAALAVFAGAAGGAAAGAVGAAINGGDLATNILMGAAFGAVGGAIAPGLSGALGGGWTGAVGTGAILGGAYGGFNAAISGGDILTGMAGGAISGAIVSAAVYGGYHALQAARAADADGCMCLSKGTRVAIRPFARHIMFGLYHYGYAVVGLEGTMFYEMGPEFGHWGDRVTIFQSGSVTQNLTPATMEAFSNNSVIWGEWSYVDGGALTAAQDAYAAAFGHRQYWGITPNSNHYVHFIFNSVGANPVVMPTNPFTPGLFAPSFPPLVP